MHNNKAENTRNRNRIPVMGPDGLKENLSIAARQTGVSAGAIARKALREWFERQTNTRICPACWETLETDSEGNPKWHLHDAITVNGDMWW